MLGFNTSMAVEPPSRPSAICDNSFSRCAPPPEGVWIRHELDGGSKGYRVESWTDSQLKLVEWVMEECGAGRLGL